MVSDTSWDFLGYQPIDNAEDHIDALRAAGVDVDGPWEWPEHGGRFAREPERPARHGFDRHTSVAGRDGLSHLNRAQSGPGTQNRKGEDRNGS
jgi:hypothetical protein